jgi:hypothetical protein
MKILKCTGSGKVELCIHDRMNQSSVPSVDESQRKYPL